MILHIYEPNKICATCCEQKLYKFNVIVQIISENKRKIEISIIYGSTDTYLITKLFQYDLLAGCEYVNEKIFNYSPVRLVNIFFSRKAPNR